MVSPISIPGFPSVHTRRSAATCDSALESRLNAVEASLAALIASLPSLIATEYAKAFDNVFDASFQKFRRGMLSRGAAVGISASLAIDDHVSSAIEPIQLPRSPICAEGAQSQLIPSAIQAPPLLSSSPLLRALATSAVKPHSKHPAAATVSFTESKTGIHTSMMTSAPPLLHEHPFSDTTKTGPEVVLNLSIILATPEATFPSLLTDYYGAYLKDKFGWVNWYLVGKFVKKNLYALDLFDAMSKRQNDNMFIQPLVHSIEVLHLDYLAIQLHYFDLNCYLGFEYGSTIALGRVFACSSGFSQKPMFGAFGSNLAQTSPFESPTQTSQAAFGGCIIGSSTPIGDMCYCNGIWDKGGGFKFNKMQLKMVTNDVYVSEINGWVSMYEVGKLMMVLNAKKVFDEIAKRQSKYAAENLFDRMTPLFHNKVVCSQFFITRGEFWNGWDPGGRLVNILGMILCSKHQENRCDNYSQIFIPQLDFINHVVHFSGLLQVLQYEKATVIREIVFDTSGGCRSFIGLLLRSQNTLEVLYLRNVAGLNMYHKTREWHDDVLWKIKRLNEKGVVSVMNDTEGQTNYEGFSGYIRKGDELVIDGVMAHFEVLEKLGSDMRCKGTHPGLFLLRAKFRFWRDRKLVERNYELPTLSTKDRSNIEFRISQGVDFIFMSFVNEVESEKHLKNHLFTSKRIIALMLYKGGRIGYGREHCKMLLGKWGVVDVNDCCSCAIYLVDSGMVDGKYLCITTNSHVVSLSIVYSRRPVILADDTYATKTDALEAVMHALVHFQGSLTFVYNRYQLLILAVMYTADEDLESITDTETELQSMEFLDRFVKWCKNIKIKDGGARKANVGIANLNFHDSGIIVLLKLNLGLSFLNLHGMLSTAALGYRKVVNENQKLYNMVQILTEDLYTAQLKISSCTGDNGWSISDATMHSVMSTTDAFKLMKFGERNRMVSSSAFSNCSSRSYGVLIVHVKGKDTFGGTLRNCLHLVDLAGSVKVENPRVTGNRRKEAQYIKKSLPCLGYVNTALAQKNSHTPHKNRKFTLMLQDSVAGCFKQVFQSFNLEDKVVL